MKHFRHIPFDATRLEKTKAIRDTAERLAELVGEVKGGTKTMRSLEHLEMCVLLANVALRDEQIEESK